MNNGLAIFTVFKGTLKVGSVKARTHAAAAAIAHGRYGICDVELPAHRTDKSRPDYLSANTKQQAKTARRYPTPGYEARREALIAEVLGR